jgi:hypothetical protein
MDLAPQSAAVYGQYVTYTITVTGYAYSCGLLFCTTPAPVGTVWLYVWDGFCYCAFIGSASLPGGLCFDFQCSSLAFISDSLGLAPANSGTGYFFLDFYYDGNDPNYATNDYYYAQQVNQASTTTSITGMIPSSLTHGQSTTVSFAVAAVPPGAGTPTGNVTVTDPGGATCTASVAAGFCTLVPIVSGQVKLIASYAGDANFTASTSAPTTISVFGPLAYLPFVTWQKALLNGDFEQGLANWQTGGGLHATGDAPVSVSSQYYYSGSQSVVVGDPALTASCNGGIPEAVAYISQSVTIPSTSHPTLTFWYRIFTQDWTGPDPNNPVYDAFTVSVNGSQETKNGGALFVAGNPPPSSSATGCSGILDMGWRQGSVDLGSYKGQTVTLYFNDWNEGSTSLNTYTYLDDVAINQ